MTADSLPWNSLDWWSMTIEIENSYNHSMKIIALLECPLYSFWFELLKWAWQLLSIQLVPKEAFYPIKCATEVIIMKAQNSWCLNHEVRTSSFRWLHHALEEMTKLTAVRRSSRCQPESKDCVQKSAIFLGMPGFFAALHLLTRFCFCFHSRWEEAAPHHAVWGDESRFGVS